MKTNTYSTIMADTMNGEYALSAELPLFTAASDTIWSRDVPPGGSLLVRTRDEIVLDLNRQIPGVKNILPDMLEIALDNIGDYNLSALKAVLEFDRRRLVPINVTSAGGRLLRLDLSGTGLTEEERTLTGNRRIRIQLKNGSMVCSNLKVCCDSKGRPLGHLRGRLQSAPEPVTEYCCQSDNNKNITSLTDDAGAICAAWEYDAYGNIINQTGEKLNVNPLRFSSEYHDEELGLVYYNYRHYNPKDGRWISRDPMEEKSGMDFYFFCINSPVNCNDIWGLTAQAIPEDIGEGWELGNQLSISPIEGRKDNFYEGSGILSVGSKLFLYTPAGMYNHFNRFVGSWSITKKIDSLMAQMESDALEWFTHFLRGSGEDKIISPAKMIEKNEFFRRKILTLAKAGYGFAVSNDILGMFIHKDWDVDDSSQQVSIGGGDYKEENTDYWSIPYILGGFNYAAVGCVERRNRKCNFNFVLYIDDWYSFHDWHSFVNISKISGAREFRTRGKSLCSYTELEGLKCFD